MIDERNFTKFLSRHEIDAVVQSLANQINSHYAASQKPLILVTILKGAVLFLADLVRHLDGEVQVEFVRLSSHGKTRNDPGTITLLKDIEVDVRDRQVLIVEEIIDSGRTLRFLYDRILACHPASLEIATLLDKPTKRVVELPVKFIGRKIEDEFLIGYGLDLEEQYRNLPDFYYLRYPN